ncbi:hypothetical protein GIB67_034166 [Kingdonia uniflora]|uniref:Flowering time control protein FY n=1 Tax=Kingdonia uniflora TaxID=39325 RepID=A0A7J7LRW6_9MAGN|nr:hypothetical protein GIB67_034166 [Kingdonia uniflora]
MMYGDQQQHQQQQQQQQPQQQQQLLPPQQHQLLPPQQHQQQQLLPPQQHQQQHLLPPPQRHPQQQLLPPPQHQPQQQLLAPPQQQLLPPPQQHLQYGVNFHSGPPPSMRPPSMPNMNPAEYSHNQVPPYDAHGDNFGAKRVRKLVQRKAVDYTSTVVRYMQRDRNWGLNPVIKQPSPRILNWIKWKQNWEQQIILNVDGCIQDGRRAFGVIFRLQNGIPIAAFNRKCEDDVGIGLLEVRAACEGLCFAGKLSFKSLCTMTDFTYAEQVMQNRINSPWVATVEITEARVIMNNINNTLYPRGWSLRALFGTIQMDILTIITSNLDVTDAHSQLLAKPLDNWLSNLNAMSRLKSRTKIRMWQRDSRDRTVVQPTPAAAIDMLPTAAYADNPSTSYAAKFVHASTNKNRCSINRVLWTPSGRRLITGSQSGEFTLWNGQSFNFEMILQAHDQAIRSMIWSHNDNWMVTGDDGGAIKYWQTNMNNVKANKSAHKESVRDLSFCRTDLKFCSCSDDTTVKVWDFARLQEERSLSGNVP